MRMGPYGVLEANLKDAGSSGAVDSAIGSDVSMSDNQSQGHNVVEVNGGSNRDSTRNQHVGKVGEGLNPSPNQNLVPVFEPSIQKEQDAVSVSTETSSISTRAPSPDLWETASYQPESDISSDDDENIDRAPRPGRKMCGCSLDVPDSWIEKLRTGKDTFIGEQLAHLSEMSRFRYVCYQHARRMGSLLGLKIHQLSQAEVLSRLGTVRDNQDTISELKTNDDTYHWFRQECRPTHPRDQLGVYKYVPQVPATFEFDPESVLRNVETLLGCPHLDIESTFEKCGSMNVPVFTWWMEDEELCRIIDDEFDMYRYHLSDESQRLDPGWTYGQLHSLCQQLMRQDPVYWMLHCALRPDRHWRLVSCPQHTRYSVEGEDSAFRRVGINLYRGIAWDIGVNMLNGSVSLDDENEDASVVLRGMHQHYAAWWNGVRARGLIELPKYPYRITDDHYTKDDRSKFGCEWVHAGCKKGEARLTMATVPHGDNPSSKPRRRTMTPQFVRLEDDMSTLEAPWFGEWRDLVDAHISLTVPRRAFRRWKSKNYCEGPPSRFPAAFALDGLGSLSDALVCRAKWDDPLVLQDRNLLLGGNIDKITEYVQEWRRNALEKVKETFKRVVEEEMNAFGKASYFMNTESLFLK